MTHDDDMPTRPLGQKLGTEDVTRDLRPKPRDPDELRRMRLSGSYLNDKGVITQEDAARDRLRQMPRPPRARRPSAINARLNAMEVLDMRLQTAECWELLTDKGQAAIRSVIGEAYDAGERRAEVKRLALEGELSEQHMKVLELEGKLAMVGADRDRARAKSTPPPMDTHAFDERARLRTRVTYLELELESRGVKVKP